MNVFSLNKRAASVLVLVLPLVMGCSVLSGGGYSSDPVVADQQRKVEALRAELSQAEKDTEYAKERERAAKSRLKAAEDELRVLKTAASRRNG
ncbi:hypothetical protein [Rufibacter psychrotolerans]|uniref:hypothetical protein n=1 Tax=Rufibacter psychrotolerans TaxID=2812556 RepID=UPI001967994E|nr:hypothetical protein [Rufibacter sp. SYSU D00308]